MYTEIPIKLSITFTHCTELHSFLEIRSMLGINICKSICKFNRSTDAIITMDAVFQKLVWCIFSMLTYQTQHCSRLHFGRSRSRIFSQYIFSCKALHSQKATQWDVFCFDKLWCMEVHKRQIVIFSAIYFYCTCTKIYNLVKFPTSVILLIIF